MTGATVTHAAIDAYFALINEERWHDLRDIWTDDAVVIAVGAPPRNGKDEIVDHYSRLFRAFSVHRDIPTRVLPCGDAVTVEVRFEGRTLHDRPVTFEAVDVFDLRDGKICRLTNWYDLVFVRKVLADD